MDLIESLSMNIQTKYINNHNINKNICDIIMYNVIDLFKKFNKKIKKKK